ncbi:MAG: VanZ family protein [Candidatus Omnitrophota bacterium]
MRISKLTIFLGIYLIASAAFSRQLWEFIQGVLGKHNAHIAGVTFLVGFAIFVLAVTFKARLNILRLLVRVLVIASAFFFAWRQPFFVEKFHVIEYGLLGWLACRDLNKNKVSFKNIILALLFASLVGVLDEGFQKLLPYRVCEIRDMLTNIVSVSFGVLLSVI